MDQPNMFRSFLFFAKRSSSNRRQRVISFRNRIAEVYLIAPDLQVQNDKIKQR